MNFNTEMQYHRLLEKNKKWVERVNAKHPDFFETLAKGQSPDFLWIGCSDSRVPANEITDTLPGEIFVHRNIANMVVHTDINMLSVLQFAVEVLKVNHVIVCGHYGCGGVKAAMGNEHLGLIDNWLRNIKDVYRFRKDEIDSIENYDLKINKMVELNVIEQVYNLSKTSIIQNQWKKERRPHLHGWVYDIKDGLIRDLGVTIKSNEDIEPIYKFYFS